MSYKNFVIKLRKEYGKQIYEGSKKDKQLSQGKIAGIIAVENASINPRASRYEHHVYNAIIKAVHDTRSRNFPGFYSKRNELKSLSEEDLVRMASSWGLGQLMGYHTLFNMSQYTLDDLVDPAKQIDVIVDFALRGLRWATTYGELLTWWNTGHIHGKTYHADYVKRAYQARDEYDRLLNKYPTMEEFLNSL